MLNLAINGRFLTQYTGGVVRVAMELVKALDKLIYNREFDINCRLICPNTANVNNLELKSIKIEKIGGPVKGHLWEQLILPIYIGSDTLLCLGNSAPIFSLLGKSQVAVMIHDLSYRLYPHAYRLRYRFGHSLLAPALLELSDIIFTVSNSEKEIIQQFSRRSPSPITVAQNGGWTAETPIIQADREDGYILYVGSMSERKNIHGVEGAAVFLARELGLRTKIVGGSGKIFSYQSPKIPPDVAPFIEYCGHVENSEELAKLYQGARALLFPSFYEASPLPPIEAMHFGCPVVASDIPSIRERCGDAVEYCDPASIRSIVDAVRRVVENENRSSQLVDFGYLRCKKFSWAEQARTIATALIGLQGNTAIYLDRLS